MNLMTRYAAAVVYVDTLHRPDMELQSSDTVC